MLTIVVPSLRTRRADLLRALAALRRELTGRRAEVLVVVEDEEAARGLEGEGSGDVEVRPIVRDGGAARRRNAALAAVRGDAVALLDDDAEPLDGWGAALARLASEGPPRIVQGAIWPAFDVEPPDELRGVLFHVGGFNRLGGARRSDVFISANCAFSRAVLDAVGPMREALGPGSGGAPWGDDTDWHRRATAAGFPTVFDDALVVRHRIQAERLTRGWVADRAEQVGRTRARLEWDGRRPGIGDVARMRILAAWARVRGGGLEGELRRRRLAGYASELSALRDA